MIDSHIHLDFKEFDRDREETIKRFFDAGGEKLINVGCDLASSERSVELARKHKNIFASVGVHPHDAQTFDETGMKKLEELVKNKKVIAIGEIGLDYFRNLSPKERQIETFKAQLEFALKYEKPVIIHCRDAYNGLLDILKSYKISDWHGAVHCYLGSWVIAEQLLNIGFYLGFTGAITYAKKSKIVNTIGAPQFQFEEPEIFKVIKNAPLDRILVETDCPYLAPVPHRGERNEPSFVKHVIEKIAEIRESGVEGVEEITSKNAKRLFEI